MPNRDSRSTNDALHKPCAIESRVYRSTGASSAVSPAEPKPALNKPGDCVTAAFWVQDPPEAAGNVSASGRACPLLGSRRTTSDAPCNGRMACCTSRFPQLVSCCEQSVRRTFPEVTQWTTTKRRCARAAAHWAWSESAWLQPPPGQRWREHHPAQRGRWRPRRPRAGAGRPAHQVSEAAVPPPGPALAGLGAGHGPPARPRREQLPRLGPPRRPQGAHHRRRLWHRARCGNRLVRGPVRVCTNQGGHHELRQAALDMHPACESAYQRSTLSTAQSTCSSRSTPTLTLPPRGGGEVGVLRPPGMERLDLLCCAPWTTVAN